MSNSSCNIGVTATTPVYKSLYSLQSDMTAGTITILATILPIQLLFFIAFCVYTCCRTNLSVQPQQKIKQDNKDKKGKDKNKNIKNQSIQNKNNLQEQAPSRLKRISNGCKKLINKFQSCLFPWTTKNRIIFLTIIIFIFLIVSIITLGMAILASEQALARQFPQAECKLNKTVTNFVKGDNQWIGLSYMLPNLTKLYLNLNTRVKATKNSINALVLNSTNVTFPIGFPNATRINDPITNTSIISTSVQTYINATLRQWLFRSSSLSGGFLFPICQNTTVSNIPHPLNDGQTIQLNYMKSICNNLTNQFNSLVANGRYVDELLVLTNSVQTSKISINNNLSALNGSLATTALRSNQYQQQFSKTGVNVDILRIFPFILIGFEGFVFAIVSIYIGSNFYRLWKYTNKEQKQQHIKQKTQRQLNYKEDKQNVNKIMIDVQNISISEHSQQSPSQVKFKKKAKIRELMRTGLFANSKFTYGINILFLLVIFGIGSSTIFYTSSINAGISFCQSFGEAINGAKKLNEIPKLSSIQKELLAPIQACRPNTLSSSFLSSSSNNNHFLQTSQTKSQFSQMERLYNISLLYNLSAPKNVLNSVSLQQIQILKGYLLHMQTMPVKAADFNMETILKQFHTYTNGSSTQSRQLAQCGSSILKDQFVYNVADCEYTLIDYINQAMITEPRCLQIPTWEGSGGTRDSDLNSAQHTIQLNNITGQNISAFFNGSSNSSFFLGKRLNLLRTSNCTITANQYNRRLKNLINFSITTASYTNSYLQNIRNYFGVYSTLSTNLTQFFNNANTSSILNQFGTLSNNLMNKTSCSYVNQALQNIYTAYCPQNNRISMLLYDCYVWIFVSFGLASFSWGLLIIWQIVMKVYTRLSKQQKDKQIRILANPDSSLRKPKKEKKKQKNIKQTKDKQNKNHKLQISEQTLRNEEPQQDNMNRIQRLQVIKNQPNQQQQIQIDYLRAPKNYRNLKNIRKIQKQSSQRSQSKNNTEEQQGQYEDNFYNQGTAKKLLPRHVLYQNKNVNDKKGEAQQDQNQNEEQKQQPIQYKINNQLLNYNSQQSGHNNKQHNITSQSFQPKIKTKIIELQSANSSQKSKKNFPFFTNMIEPSQTKNIQLDSRKYDFDIKQQIKKQRVVKSKAQNRPEADLSKHQKGQKSIIKVTKQGRQAQRLKITKLDQMVKDAIELDTKNLNKDQEPKGQKQQRLNS